MKIAILSLALMAATFCHASFELALVSDTLGRKVDRYDPQTGTYLGSFGQGLLGDLGAIDIDQSAGIAYVADSSYSKIHKFNYSTGEYLGILPVSVSTYFLTRLSNGNLLASSYGNVNPTYITNNGTTGQSVNTSPVYMEGIAQTGNGRIWYLSGIGGVAHKLYSTTDPLVSPTLTYTGSVNTGTTTGLCAYGNQLAFAQYNSTSTNFTMYAFGTNGTGISSFLSGTATLPSSSYGIIDGAFGHNGAAYFTATDFGTSKLVKFNTNTGFTSTINLSYTTSAHSIAVVVAPEPSSYIAMGIGLTVLLRLRRQRRS